MGSTPTVRTNQQKGKLITALIGWIGTTIIIVTYGLSVKYENPRIFHKGNVIGAIMLVPVQLAAGVPYAALLSGMFGTLGFLALLKKPEKDLPV